MQTHPDSLITTSAHSVFPCKFALRTLAYRVVYWRKINACLDYKAGKERVFTLQLDRIINVGLHVFSYANTSTPVHFDGRQMHCNRCCTGKAVYLHNTLASASDQCNVNVWLVLEMIRRRRCSGNAENHGQASTAALISQSKTFLLSTG